MIISGCMRRGCDMRNVLRSLGVVMLAVGVSIADSDNLVIPIILTVVGSIIMLFVSKEDCNE